jgi:hypothetical protein
MMNNKREIDKINNKENNDNNFITLQFTLFDVTGKYKPISTLVKVESMKWFREHYEEVKQNALQKICNQRRISGRELAKLGYSKLKIRNYDLWIARNNKKGIDKKKKEG